MTLIFDASVVWFTNTYLHNIQFAEEYTHTYILSHLLAPTLVKKSVNIGAPGNQFKPVHIIIKLISACNFKVQHPRCVSTTM
jgi:hypothetical protein